MYSELGVEQGDEHWSDWFDTYLFLPDFHVKQQLSTRGQPSHFINSPYFPVALQTHLVDGSSLASRLAFVSQCHQLLAGSEDEIPNLELSSVLRK